MLCSPSRFLLFQLASHSCSRMRALVPMLQGHADIIHTLVHQPSGRRRMNEGQRVLKSIECYIAPRGSIERHAQEPCNERQVTTGPKHTKSDAVGKQRVTNGSNVPLAEPAKASARKTRESRHSHRITVGHQAETKQKRL